VTAWYENDDFWETVAPVLFNRERIDLAPQQVDQVIALLRLNAGAVVLDLCCGIGRHALELSRRGYVVTGVDRTRAYLKRARAQAAAEDLKVEFIESDARAFRRAGAFDGAINLFTSFGYFEDPAEDLKVAENLHASLKPGARLVVDLIGKENLARRFRERDWHENSDGTLVLEDRKLRNGWDWLENRWILIKGGERKELTLSHRLYSGSELAALLKQAGFAAVTLYGDLSGAPYNHRAERLVAVAEK
jgi:SAM-dependent methyltransferase